MTHLAETLAEPLPYRHAPQSYAFSASARSSGCKRKARRSAGQSSAATANTPRHYASLLLAWPSDSKLAAIARTHASL